MENNLNLRLSNFFNYSNLIFENSLNTSNEALYTFTITDNILGLYESLNNFLNPNFPIILNNNSLEFSIIDTKLPLIQNINNLDFLEYLEILTKKFSNLYINLMNFYDLLEKKYKYFKENKSVNNKSYNSKSINPKNKLIDNLYELIELYKVLLKELTELIDKFIIDEAGIINYESSNLKITTSFNYLEKKLNTIFKEIVNSSLIYQSLSNLLDNTNDFLEVTNLTSNLRNSILEITNLKNDYNLLQINPILDFIISNSNKHNKGEHTQNFRTFDINEFF